MNNSTHLLIIGTMGLISVKISNNSRIIRWLIRKSLPFQPFYTFYYHHPFLAQMRRMSVRSSVTQLMLENWWTRLNVHEGHGSVSWRCLFLFHHPLHHFLLCARLNTMTQCAILPDSSIIASNFPKWE